MVCNKWGCTFPASVRSNHGLLFVPWRLVIRVPYIGLYVSLGGPLESPENGQAYQPVVAPLKSPWTEPLLPSNLFAHPARPTQSPILHILLPTQSPAPSLPSYHKTCSVDVRSTTCFPHGCIPLQRAQTQAAIPYSTAFCLAWPAARPSQPRWVWRRVHSHLRPVRRVVVGLFGMSGALNSVEVQVSSLLVTHLIRQ